MRCKRKLLVSLFTVVNVLLLVEAQSQRRHMFSRTGKSIYTSQACHDLLQMNYLQYVRELIDFDAGDKAHISGVQTLGYWIHHFFLKQFDGDAEKLAISNICTGSQKNVALEISILLRQALKKRSCKMFVWLCMSACGKVCGHIIIPLVMNLANLTNISPGGPLP